VCGRRGRAEVCLVGGDRSSYQYTATGLAPGSDLEFRDNQGGGTGRLVVGSSGRFPGGMGAGDVGSHITVTAVGTASLGDRFTITLRWPPPQSST
jgi:hypothetical protein